MGRKQQQERDDRHAALKLRIRAAWLARFPEPGGDHGSPWYSWLGDRNRLDQLLAADAFASAIMECIVPKQWDMTLSQGENGGLAFVSPHAHRSTPDIEGATAAEALLSAVEEAFARLR